MASAGNKRRSISWVAGHHGVGTAGKEAGCWLARHMLRMWGRPVRELDLGLVITAGLEGLGVETLRCAGLMGQW